MGLCNVSVEYREAERQRRIDNYSKIVADVAEELLDSDAGAGCIQAALLCWDRRYGKEATTIIARTALLGVCGELDRGGGRTD